MLVFVFEGAGEAYALTCDESGRNLPLERGPWRPVGAINMQDGEAPRAGLDTAAALAAIARDGYHLEEVRPG
ncbi:MAG: hypothetical protein LCH88_19520 [Proteobacteria bacterium]|nr:hypothetical protein [Pseudomonadota bacterium]